MPPIHIRLATEADLRAIDDIYNWYISRSTCTYQEQPDSFEQRVEWFAHHGPKHPVTVAELDGEIVGWGALSEFRERTAYRHSVENSVYVRHDSHGRGIGSALLKDLVERARTLGHRTIIGVLDGEQAASVALHKKFAFTVCGEMKQVGFKFDRWLDVIFMQLML